MRKEKILKLMVVLTIGIVLVAMTSNVFAADSNSTVDFFEDTTNQLNTNTNTYLRPSKNSKIAFSCKQNQKIHICGQWENWYIVEESNIFGYIPTNYLCTWISGCL